MAAPMTPPPQMTTLRGGGVCLCARQLRRAWSCRYGRFWSRRAHKPCMQAALSALEGRLCAPRALIACGCTVLQRHEGAVQPRLTGNMRTQNTLLLQFISIRPTHERAAAPCARPSTASKLSRRFMRASASQATHRHHQSQQQLQSSPHRCCAHADAATQSGTGCQISKARAPACPTTDAFPARSDYCKFLNLAELVWSHLVRP